MASGASRAGCIVAYKDSANVWHLHLLYAGDDNTTEALRHRALHSGVDTGTPGALTAEITLDAGGANAGVWWPSAFVTNTATNPRIWVIATKQTAATPTRETRVWFVGTGTAADTAGNWSTTNFTNLGAEANDSDGHNGAGFWWKVAGAERATIVFMAPSGADEFEAVHFDPTAATPTPGTPVSLASIDPNSFSSIGLQGPLFALGGRDDYLVCSRVDRADNRIDLWKTVNGTTWTQPSGWTDIGGGRHQLVSDGTDVWLVYVLTLVTGSGTDALKYRKITASSDAMGGEAAYSDQGGNVPSCLIGGGKLFSLYRAGTASPFSIRSDFVAVAGAGGVGDTVPPALASALTATPHRAGARIDVQWNTPPDSDLSAKKVLRRTDQFPSAQDDASATVVVPEQASSPNTTESVTDTGLTNGQRYFYAIFHKDTGGNWNSGALKSAVAHTPVTLSSPADDAAVAVKPLLVFLADASDVEPSRPVHFKLEHAAADDGTALIAPVTVVSSRASQAGWEYEQSASVWRSLPAAGLAAADVGKAVRWQSDIETPRSWWAYVDQER